MKSISVAIAKGGVGKTTTAVNIAHGLALKGFKTVLVDCDPQGNATTNYITELPLYELADVLYGRVSTQEALVQLRDNLYLLPTHAVDGELREYGTTKIPSEPFIFQDLVSELVKLKFDYCIYDLSPGFGLLEKAVMVGSDEVITPLLPESFSVDGLLSFSSDLGKLKKSMRISIKYDKLIINNVNLSLNIHNESILDIKNNVAEGMKVFIIPQDVKIKEAQRLNKSIFEYKRPNDKTEGNSRSVEAFNELIGAL